MARQLKNHSYKGETIRPCGCDKRAGDGSRYRWYTVTYHGLTGLVWSESECLHTYSLPEAYARIDQGH